VNDDQLPDPQVGPAPSWLTAKCDTCGLVKDATSFPVKGDGSAGKMCHECIKTAGARHAEREEEAKKKKARQELLLRLRRSTSQAPDVEQLLVKLIALEKGFDEMCKSWHKAVHETSGTKYLIEHYRLLSKLMVTTREQQQAEADELSDDELDEQLEVELEAHLQRHRESTDTEDHRGSADGTDETV
jgi:hypothetical protein